MARKVIPKERFDMQKVFCEFQKEPKMRELIADIDRIGRENGHTDQENLSIRMFYKQTENIQSIQFSNPNFGTITVQFWDKYGEDQIFYRKPDAPKGSGLGAWIGSMDDDGHNNSIDDELLEQTAPPAYAQALVNLVTDVITSVRSSDACPHKLTEEETKEFYGGWTGAFTDPKHREICDKYGDFKDR